MGESILLKAKEESEPNLRAGLIEKAVKNLNEDPSKINLEKVIPELIELGCIVGVTDMCLRKAAKL